MDDDALQIYHDPKAATWELRAVIDSQEREIESLRKTVAERSPPFWWVPEVAGYGQFVDGKLVACSQAEIRISVGSKNVECRPLYSVAMETPNDLDNRPEGGLPPKGPR